MEDNVIIQKMQAGDEQGFLLLMEKYCAYVSAVLCNLTRGVLASEDVEELAADVFLSIWNHADRLFPKASLKPYLAQTARNAARSKLRAYKGESVPFDDTLLSTLSDPEDPQRLSEQNEQAALLNQAVEAFDQVDRELFTRYYYFNEPLKKIARRLQLKESTAKTRLRRCRTRLQAMFLERGYGREKSRQHS